MSGERSKEGCWYSSSRCSILLQWQSRGRWRVDNVVFRQSHSLPFQWPEAKEWQVEREDQKDGANTTVCIAGPHVDVWWHFSNWRQNIGGRKGKMRIEKDILSTWMCILTAYTCQHPVLCTWVNGRSRGTEGTEEEWCVDSAVRW